MGVAHGGFKVCQSSSSPSTRSCGSFSSSGSSSDFRFFCGGVNRFFGGGCQLSRHLALLVHFFLVHQFDDKAVAFSLGHFLRTVEISLHLVRVTALGDRLHSTFLVVSHGSGNVAAHRARFFDGIFLRFGGCWGTSLQAVLVNVVGIRYAFVTDVALDFFGGASGRDDDQQYDYSEEGDSHRCLQYGGSE